MPPAPIHRVIAVQAWQVPKPFRAFAVRSEEPEHAMDARAPYACVHAVRTAFLAADTLMRLAAFGQARMHTEAFSDIDYASTSFAELSTLTPHGVDLAGEIASALQWTGVLGDDLAGYRRSVESRIDYLGACGAGFHNDVSRHWPRCLFWVLVLAAADVEFVMPHAGLRLALVPGELLVFDPSLAHGLCRPGDGAQALATSFDSGANRQQVFLTGEVPLTDTQWAALGAPWLPVEVHDRLGALDLLVAEFDERSGAIKRLRALQQGMKRSTCHVDETGR